MILVITRDGEEETFCSKAHTTWITDTGQLLINKRIGTSSRLHKAFAEGTWATVENTEPAI